MQLQIKQLMKNYNYFIKRNYNGEKFLNSDSFYKGTKEQQEIWIRAFQEIAWELSVLRKQIEPLLGREMTNIEILEGFKEVGGDG